YESFSRGFVAFLERSGRGFVKRPDRFATVTPVEAVNLRDVENYLEAIAAQPYLARLRHLSLTLYYGDLGPLARSPHLGQLEQLSFQSGGFDARSLRELARAQMPRLRSLHVDFNDKIHPDAVGELLDAPGLPALRELELVYTHLGRSGGADGVARLFG